MPTWGKIQGRITELSNRGQQDAYDLVRREYLKALSIKRGRAVVLYATRFTQGNRPGLSADMLSITEEDLQGLMTALHGLQETSLDLILHSPGGSIEATEGLVKYLRLKFPDDICVIVPQLALSAAAMITCSANSVMMGKHSYLGPTDPQMFLQTELGARHVTAQNVEDQFKMAQKECADPAKIGAWIPVLKQYGPDLLQKCQHASQLSKSLVAEWLERYMFKDQPNKHKKAIRIAKWMSNHKTFKTHGRHLGRDDLRKEGFDTIIDLESDQEVQDQVLSIFHATTLTFDGTTAVKIIENHNGMAFIKTASAPQMMTPPQMLVGGPARPQFGPPVRRPMPSPTHPIAPKPPSSQSPPSAPL